MSDVCSDFLLVATGNGAEDAVVVGSVQLSSVFVSSSRQ